ncbi:FHA domain-containing protein [Microbacterium sp. Ld14]|uniref:FHA domain-containing protein n=1 Tax=Microbacterium sp. Ld14 TaxID=649156 RepID=UPI0038648FCF
MSVGAGTIGAATALGAMAPDPTGLLAGASVGVALAQVAGALAVYAWLALALMAVFRKVGQPTWKAWVPVLNLWTLFELAGMRGWWAVVQVGAGIVFAVIATIVAGSLVTASVDAAFNGADAASAFLAATVVPALIWLVYAALVVALQFVMMQRLNPGFGLGTGFSVLGAVLLPVWASIVGWGSATWRGRPRAQGLPPTPFAATAPAPEPAGRDTSAAMIAFAPPSAADAPAASPVSASADAPAPLANGNPWVPPPLASPLAAPPVSPLAAPPASAQAAPPASASVAATPPPYAAPAPAAAPAADDELDEHTVLAAHRRPGATLHLPGGAVVTLTGETAVLGRNPVAPSDSPDAQRIAIDDVTRTVSKTHALLRLEGGSWTITDLASTNGVFVGDADDEAEVSGRAPLAGRFLLGDAELRLATDPR